MIRLVQHGSRTAVSLLFAVAVVGLAGCGSKGKTVEAPGPEPGSAQANLEAIFEAYNAFTSKNARAPKNVDELKPLLKTYGDPDKLLISPNDNLPFEIVFPASGQLTSNGPNPPIMAYEKKGKDGKHYAINLSAYGMHLTDEELKKAPFPAGYKVEF